MPLLLGSSRRPSLEKKPTAGHGGHFKRSRPVQTLGQDRERTGPIYLHEGAVFGSAGGPSNGPSQTPCARAKRVRPRPNSTLVGYRSGLGDVDRVPRDCQAGRDDVAERDQLGDLAIAGDPQHPVVVPIGNEEPAEEGDVDHPAAEEEDAREAGRQPAGEESEGAGLRVDAPDAAGQGGGDEKRPSGFRGELSVRRVLPTAGSAQPVVYPYIR